MLLGPLAIGVYEFGTRYALKIVVDAFESSQVNSSKIRYAIILFIAANVIFEACWRIANLAEWKSQPFIRRNIILAAYDHIQRYSYGFFQETFVGMITSKIKGMVDGYDNVWNQISSLGGLINSICLVVVLVTATAIVNIKVCMLISVWSIAYLAFMYKVSGKLEQYAHAQTESMHKAFGWIADNLANIFALMSFATRARELRRIDDHLSGDLIPKQQRMYKYTFKTELMGGALHVLMLSLTFVWMVRLRTRGEVTTGDLMFVITTLNTVSWTLYYLMLSLRDLITRTGDLKSAFAVLTVQQDPIDPPNAGELRVTSPCIRFENIEFSYDDQPVIKDLTLHIKSGEKIGIVGLSGAGKSTLVSVLLKYFPLSHGRIIIDSQNIANVTSDSLRHQVSLIPQDITLFHRSIMENIRYGRLDATDADVVKAARKANIHEFIAALPQGYDTEVGERGVKLSGGQRQRIAIARAILKNAPILILDEATSSLDVQTERLIQESIDDLLKNKKVTVIAIAHRLATLKHMDRIVVLGGGKVVEEGKHAQLIKRSKVYKKLWEMQQI
jgi:ATP-binding cassette subfamily B protein